MNENIEIDYEKVINDFPYFVKYIFPLSVTNYRHTSHMVKWAKRIQQNTKTATLSARRHLKSTLMYAYIMWRLFRCIDHSESWLYMSYTTPLSYYHTKEIKKYILKNPYFKHFKDLSGSDSMIKYTLDGKNIFECMPASISRFNRGWHGYGVICDDILADPTNELNITVIEGINRAFFEEVLSLPIEGGELHLVGTAQHQEDLFFKIKDNPTFQWEMYPAILDEAKKEVIWPEMFPYKRLCELRTHELGEKAFSKEYMCVPVWSANAFFTRDVIMSVVNPKLKNRRMIKNAQELVTAGLDIGKKAHPSHLAVFVWSNGKAIQIYSKFFDGVDYIKQVNEINELITVLGISTISYDNTRGEFESFVEQKIIDSRVWKPISFSTKTKFEMAVAFEKMVTNKEIELMNDIRQTKLILSVTNDLEALETVDGHGDSFWSIGLAVRDRRGKYRPYIA